MKISIITAVYNRVSTIGTALASLTGQTYLDTEHVVIDGGSSDGTLAELSPWPNWPATARATCGWSASRTTASTMR